MSKLVLDCVEGARGSEILTGIPGSIGGAVKMSAGAIRHIGSVVDSVTLMDGQGIHFGKSRPELIRLPASIRPVHLECV